LDERGVVVVFGVAHRDASFFVVADKALGDFLFAVAIAVHVVETILVGV
jgi:hypothetical protein